MSYSSWPPNSDKVHVRFTTHYDVSNENDVVGVIGSCKYLGNWDSESALLLERRGVKGCWSSLVKLPLSQYFEWKLVVFDRLTREIRNWEEYPNRWNWIDRGPIEIIAGWNSKEIIRCSSCRCLVGLCCCTTIYTNLVPPEGLVNVTFRVIHNIDDVNQTIAIVGSSKFLGDWNPTYSRLFSAHKNPVLTIKLPVNTSFEWKLAILNSQHRKVIHWEECKNRALSIRTCPLEVGVTWGKGAEIGYRCFWLDPDWAVAPCPCGRRYCNTKAIKGNERQVKDLLEIFDNTSKPSSDSQGYKSAIRSVSNKDREKKIKSVHFHKKPVSEIFGRDKVLDDYVEVNKVNSEEMMYDYATLQEKTVSSKTLKNKGGNFVRFLIDNSEKEKTDDVLYSFASDTEDGNLTNCMESKRSEQKCVRLADMYERRKENYQISNSNTHQREDNGLDRSNYYNTGDFKKQVKMDVVEDNKVPNLENLRTEKNKDNCGFERNDSLIKKDNTSAEEITNLNKRLFNKDEEIPSNKGKDQDHFVSESEAKESEIINNAELISDYMETAVGNFEEGDNFKMANDAKDKHSSWLGQSFKEGMSSSNVLVLETSKLETCFSKMDSSLSVSAGTNKQSKDSVLSHLKQNHQVNEKCAIVSAQITKLNKHVVCNDSNTFSAKRLQNNLKSHHFHTRQETFEKEYKSVDAFNMRPVGGGDLSLSLNHVNRKQSNVVDQSYIGPSPPKQTHVNKLDSGIGKTLIMSEPEKQAPDLDSPFSVRDYHETHINLSSQSEQSFKQDKGVKSMSLNEQQNEPHTCTSTMPGRLILPKSSLKSSSSFVNEELTSQSPKSITKRINFNDMPLLKGQHRKISDITVVEKKPVKLASFEDLLKYETMSDKFADIEIASEKTRENSLINKSNTLASGKLHDLSKVGIDLKNEQSEPAENKYQTEAVNDTPLEPSHHTEQHKSILSQSNEQVEDVKLHCSENDSNFSNISLITSASALATVIVVSCIVDRFVRQ